MKKIVYSPNVLRRLKELKEKVTEEFGCDVAIKVLEHIVSGIENLTVFESQGASVASMYDIKTDYRYLFIEHNYVFYRIEKDRIIIVEIFHEREEFIKKLFG